MATRRIIGSTISHDSTWKYHHKTLDGWQRLRTEGIQISISSLDVVLNVNLPQTVHDKSEPVVTINFHILHYLESVYIKPFFFIMFLCTRLVLLLLFLIEVGRNSM